MSEINELKARIKNSGREGVQTKRIRDDYEPVGHLMIRRGAELQNILTAIINFLKNYRGISE